MHVSAETPEQTEKRLRRVISTADLDWHEGSYSFSEYSLENFPVHEASQSLAFIRDEKSWSVLRKSRPEDAESFALFSFHFPDGMDNSGFVGWLATIMKRELGTGVFVICGHNSRRGGIFDYWGIPISVRAAAVERIKVLRRSDSR